MLLRGRVAFSAEGQPALAELPKELREQLRTRLAERRVVQHLPASMSDMASDQTVWRLFDPNDTHRNAKRLGRWLAAAGVKVPKPDASTVIIITRKRKTPTTSDEEVKAKKGKFHEGRTWEWHYAEAAKDALLGFAPTGDPAESKLKPFKAVKVLGDNFGIALDPEPKLIRPLHVWRQINGLKTANGGKWPRILRKGSIVRIAQKAPRADYRGVWMVRGLNYKQRDGFVIGIAPCDFVPDRRVPCVFESASLHTLLKCGLEILEVPICGVDSSQQRLAKSARHS